MDGGFVAIVALVIARAGCEVEGTGDLFIEERILHGAVDIGIHAQRPFAHVARALVGIEDGVEPLRIAAGSLHDFAILEREGDVFEGHTLIGGFGVVGDRAVHGIAHGRGVDFAVRNVQMAVTGNGGHARDGKAQIRARAYDMYVVCAL